MENKVMNTEQGHWILAKMGKRVLRPGGKELTEKLINGLAISNQDDFVEFAPGIGYTASVILSQNPKSYKGIELNQEAISNLKIKFQGNPHVIFINRSASDTGIAENSIDKIIGEAMLTMQADHRKAEIIKEANRILKKGGLYGIHELGLHPDNIAPELKSMIQRGLAETIKVNARPLTKVEWCELLEKEGFKIKAVHETPMHLLRAKRMIDDEGLFRTLKIGFKIMTHPKAKNRIFSMRKVFEKYEKQMVAYAIIAEKV